MAGRERLAGDEIRAAHRPLDGTVRPDCHDDRAGNAGGDDGFELILERLHGWASLLRRHFAPRRVLTRNYVTADTRFMEANLDQLRGELARLEAEAAQLSLVRDRLHQQIDFGYGSDTTREREREVSDERRRVHERIDALRALLGVQAAS